MYRTTSIGRRESNPINIQQNNSYPVSHVREFLNMRRITKDKGCLIIFLIYSLALVIMMGMGFFYGNYGHIGKFIAGAAENIKECQRYINESLESCQQNCNKTNTHTFLGKICTTIKYKPEFSQQVSHLITMHDIKSTFPMIIYVSFSLLVITTSAFLTLIFIPKLVYLFISTLFFMLLGMAFYLLKNVQLRIQTHNLDQYPNSIFYQYEQYARSISFLLLGLYLLIFPFILFSPKKIQLGTFLIGKLKQFYQSMKKIVLVTVLVVCVVWATLILEILLIMHFYSAGFVNDTPQYSMFYTYQGIYLNHPVALTFYFIGIIWVYSTIISWHKYFISSAMVMWYFQQSQTLHTIKRVLRRSLYHVGSAALDGILFPVQWLLLLIYTIVKTNTNNQSQNQQPKQKQQILFITRYIDSIRKCFIQCYKCINRDGSNSSGLTNYGFFQSCQNANQIFSMKEHLFFNIGGTLTLFFTLFVSIFWIVIMHFILYFSTYNKQFPPIISSMILPLFLVFIIGVVIGCLLSNIFASSIDCLVYCYLHERKWISEGSQIQRNQQELKIKKQLNQWYCTASDKSQDCVYVYTEIDENSLQITYISKKQ